VVKEALMQGAVAGQYRQPGMEAEMRLGKGERALGGVLADDKSHLHMCST
jgi:hypothetical protein